MNAERWHRIKDILYCALELAPELRDAYLEQACGADGALRREVETLVAASEQAGEFLEPPPAHEPAQEENLIGSLIGHYRLDREIGRGGMGAVYHAVRDDEFLQEAAIKVIKRGMDTDELLARFRHERQILALLSHPNIARMLDGGSTSSGRLYFVMEFVAGEPITSYCEEKKLNIEQRLRLFLKVCAAVGHAHRHLVIHRDLKPANILITAEGEPKLLDFGIAKMFSPDGAGETTRLTTVHTRVLTPEYASPEQVRGERITTSSDVYSLGAVLYELLSGAKAHQFASTSPTELERIVCETTPARPSEAAGGSRELRGDLDNILLKALQKQPERRYLHVGQFADDIGRYLEGRPVLARPDTIRYRALKFWQRNKALTTAAMLVFLTLLGGIAATSWEARIARAERARAERRFNDVRKLADSFLFQIHDLIENLPGSTQARSFLVKEALEYLDSLAAESHGDIQLRREVAAAYEKVGKVQGNPQFPNLGDTRGAVASYRKSLEIRQALANGDPANRQFQLELAASRGQFGDLLWSTGDTAGAVSESGRALAIYERLAPEFPRDRAFQAAFATRAYSHANLLRKYGDLDGSLAKYRLGVEIGNALIAANREDSEGWIHLAASLDGMGVVLTERGDTAAALEDRRQALEIRERLAAADRNNAHYRRQVAFSHHNLALSLIEAGDLTGALKELREELRLFESLRAADPNDVQARRNLSVAHKQIGDVLVRVPDLNAALSHYGEALKIDQGISSKDPGSAQALIDLSFSEGKFGFVLAKLGRAADGLTLVRKGVKLQESLMAKDPHNDLLRGYVANSYTRLAQSLSAAHDETAVEYFRKALELRQAQEAKSSNNAANRAALAECYANLGEAIAPGHPAEALEHYRRSIELLDRLTAADVNNAQYRMRLSGALTDAARIYARLAALPSEPDTLRNEQRNQARALYKRSQDSWAQLETGGKLPAGYRRMPAMVARELASLPNR